MKRIAALLLCVIWMLTLSGCSTGLGLLGLVRDCWKEVGEDGIEPVEVCVIAYSSRLNLTGEVSDAPLYAQLPQSGYAVLFHSLPADEPFHDDFACFADRRGNIAVIFDYEESDKLFEEHYGDYQAYGTLSDGVLALEHISNCNFYSGMLNGVEGETIGLLTEKNTWYSLSDRQIRWTCR